MNDMSFQPRWGRTKGVLLLHGLTGAPGEMRRVGRRLSRLGFITRAPLLAGHGGDVAGLLRSGWRDWLASVRAAYLALAAEVDDVYVAGICVGGALGLLLCAEFPEIRGAAVYSMTFEYDGWNMPGWATAAPVIQLVANLPLVRRIAFKEPYPYGLKDLRLRELASRAPDLLVEGGIDHLPLGSLYEMYRLGRAVERAGPTITTPTLIVHAQDDDMSHPRNAERLRSALAGRTELLLLEDSYHMVHVDRQHAQVAQRTAAFFSVAVPLPAREEEPVDA